MQNKTHKGHNKKISTKIWSMTDWFSIMWNLYYWTIRNLTFVVTCLFTAIRQSYFTILVIWDFVFKIILRKTLKMKQISWFISQIIASKINTKTTKLKKMKRFPAGSWLKKQSEKKKPLSFIMKSKEFLLQLLLLPRENSLLRKVLINFWVVMLLLMKTVNLIFLKSIPILQCSLILKLRNKCFQF